MPDRVSGATARLPDYYEQLEVSPRASFEVIQAAYRALARSHHPDRNPTPAAAERMQQLNVAYATLCDPARRQAYEAQRARNYLRSSSARRTGRVPRPAEVQALRQPARLDPGRLHDALLVPTSMAPLTRLVLCGVMAILVLAVMTIAVWAVAALADDTPALSHVEFAVENGGGDAPGPVIELPARRH